MTRPPAEPAAQGAQLLADVMKAPGEAAGEAAHLAQLAQSPLPLIAYLAARQVAGASVSPARRLPERVVLNLRRRDLDALPPPPRIRGGLPAISAAAAKRALTVPPAPVSAFEPSEDDRRSALEATRLPDLSEKAAMPAWLLAAAVLIVGIGLALIA